MYSTLLKAALVGGMLFGFSSMTASADSNRDCRDRCERDCRLLAGDVFGPGGGNGSQIAHCIGVCVQFSCPTSRVQARQDNVVEAALELSGYFTLKTSEEDAPLPMPVSETDLDTPAIEETEGA